MNIKNKLLFERMKKKRQFAQLKRERMQSIGEKVKMDIQNMDNIKYKDIGTYPIPTNPSPEFRANPINSNCGYTPGTIVNFQSEDIPTRIRSLQIKQRYQPLISQEQKELMLYYGNQNKVVLEKEREDARNQRFFTEEAFKTVRKWI
ncbi:MAG: hypothetical protein FWK04_30085 [Nostoc sp. GBBB01]|nr:hypothetical protein [Nostoc sp. GBBB01]